MDSLIKGLITLFGVFLLGMFVLMGYFVWYRPRQCYNKGSDGVVATWAWNNSAGKCYPATCSQGTLNQKTHACDVVLKK